MAYFFDSFEVKKTHHGKLLGLVFKSSIDEDEWAFVVDAEISKDLAEEMLSKLNSDEKSDKKHDDSYLA